MKQEIIDSFNTLLHYKNISFLPYMNQKEWSVLFDFYNEQHPGKYPLSMGCSPCYVKVYDFIKKKIKEGDTD